MKSDTLTSEFNPNYNTYEDKSISGSPTNVKLQNDSSDEHHIDTLGALRMAGIRAVVNSFEHKLVYVGIISLSMVIALEANVRYAILPGALKSFNAVSISSLLSTIVTLLGILLVPLFSKAADYFGRPETLLFCLVIYLVGDIVLCTSSSFAAFSGGFTIVNIGYTGYEVLKQVVIADITSLANRANLLGIDIFPSILFSWVSAFAADPIMNTIGWQWGVGIPTILIVPGSFLLFFMMLRLQTRAIKTLDSSFFGNIKLNFSQKIKGILQEMDIIGFLLLVISLMFIMLPLILAPTLEQGWNTPSMIILECLGGVLLIGLFIWEKKYAKYPLIQWNLFTTKTVVGAFILNFFVNIDYGMTWEYLTIYFMQSRKIDLTHVNLLYKGYHVGYLVGGLIAGPLVKKLNDYKWTLVFATGFNVLGLGLMIPARFPHASDAFIVTTQAICGIASAMIASCILIACQGSVSRKEVSIITASLMVVGKVGHSIGSTLSGAIWVNLVPKMLLEKVSVEFDMVKAMGDYTYFWNFPIEQFDKAVEAFGEGQKIISIVSSVMASIGFLIALFAMRPINLKEVQKFDETIENKDD